MRALVLAFAALLVASARCDTRFVPVGDYGRVHAGFISAGLIESPGYPSLVTMAGDGPAYLGTPDEHISGDGGSAWYPLSWFPNRERPVWPFKTATGHVPSEFCETWPVTSFTSYYLLNVLSGYFDRAYSFSAGSVPSRWKATWPVAELGPLYANTADYRETLGGPFEVGPDGPMTRLSPGGGALGLGLPVITPLAWSNLANLAKCVRSPDGLTALDIAVNLKKLTNSASAYRCAEQLANRWKLKVRNTDWASMALHDLLTLGDETAWGFTTVGSFPEEVPERVDDLKQGFFSDAQTLLDSVREMSYAAPSNSLYLTLRDLYPNDEADFAGVGGWGRLPGLGGPVNPADETGSAGDRANPTNETSSSGGPVNPYNVLACVGFGEPRMRTKSEDGDDPRSCLKGWAFPDARPTPGLDSFNSGLHPPVTNVTTLLARVFGAEVEYRDPSEDTEPNLTNAPAVASLSVADVLLNPSDGAAAPVSARDEVRFSKELITMCNGPSNPFYELDTLRTNAVINWFKLFIWFSCRKPLGYGFMDDSRFTTDGTNAHPYVTLDRFIAKLVCNTSAPLDSGGVYPQSVTVEVPVGQVDGQVSMANARPAAKLFSGAGFPTVFTNDWVVRNHFPYDVSEFRLHETRLIGGEESADGEANVMWILSFDSLGGARACDVYGALTNGVGEFVTWEETFNRLFKTNTVYSSSFSIGSTVGHNNATGRGFQAPVYRYTDALLKIRPWFEGIYPRALVAPESYGLSRLLAYQQLITVGQLLSLMDTTVVRRRFDDVEAMDDATHGLWSEGSHLSTTYHWWTGSNRYHKVYSPVVLPLLYWRACPVEYRGTNVTVSGFGPGTSLYEILGSVSPDENIDGTFAEPVVTNAPRVARGPHSRSFGCPVTSLASRGYSAEAHTGVDDNAPVSAGHANLLSPTNGTPFAPAVRMPGSDASKSIGSVAYSDIKLRDFDWSSFLQGMYDFVSRYSQAVDPYLDDPSNSYLTMEIDPYQGYFAAELRDGVVEYTAFQVKLKVGYEWAAQRTFTATFRPTTREDDQPTEFLVTVEEGGEEVGGFTFYSAPIKVRCPDYVHITACAQASVDLFTQSSRREFLPSMRSSFDVFIPGEGSWESGPDCPPLSEGPRAAWNDLDVLHGFLLMTNVDEYGVVPEVAPAAFDWIANGGTPDFDKLSFNDFYDFDAFTNAYPGLAPITVGYTSRKYGLPVDTDVDLAVGVLDSEYSNSVTVTRSVVADAAGIKPEVRENVFEGRKVTPRVIRDLLSPKSLPVLFMGFVYDGVRIFPSPSYCLLRFRAGEPYSRSGDNVFVFYLDSFDTVVGRDDQDPGAAVARGTAVGPGGVPVFISDSYNIKFGDLPLARVLAVPDVSKKETDESVEAMKDSFGRCNHAGMVISTEAIQTISHAFDGLRRKPQRQ